jgi:hypothetical protein
MKNTFTSCIAALSLLLCVAGCARFSLRGKVDLFKDDQAAQAAAKIKRKIGAEVINVISGEIRPHSMRVTIQAPDNPKNLDEYKFEDGEVTGPKPVKTVNLGNMDMTADKYNVTNFDDIDFAAVPETVRKAIELSTLENAKVDLISMDQESAERTDPKIKEDRNREKDALTKELNEKRDQCVKGSAAPNCVEELQQLVAKEVTLAVDRPKTKWELTWRIFVEAPRGRKDFWADKKGNINEKPF